MILSYDNSTLLLRDSRPRICGLAAYIRSGFFAAIKKKNVCTCHEFQIIRFCIKSNNCYLFSLYHNPDLDDSIYDCLLSSISNIQELDRKSSFIFFSNLNTHHQEWLKSVSPTDRHSIAAFDFANLSSYTQLIKDLTHKLGNCLDLLFTDVPGVVDHSVDPPLGNSDHSSISFTVKMSFKITNITFFWKVYLKSRIGRPCDGEDLLNFN